MDKAEFGWTIILTGKDVKTQMEDETEITYHTMAASNRDSNIRDRTMYRDVEHPWGALVEPDWAVSYHAVCLKKATLFSPGSPGWGVHLTHGGHPPIYRVLEFFLTDIVATDTFFVRPRWH
jgi:hypothetical protein